MRIGIDFHTVNNFMQGSRTYIYNLTKALIEIDQKNEYYLYTTDKKFELPKELQGANVRKRLVVPANRMIRLPISFPLILAYDRIDLFHCQYIGPPFSLTPMVITIHDIIHETYPEYYPELLKSFMRLTYPFCARKTAKILTVSEYSKKDIADKFGISTNNITVTPNAVSGDFRPFDESALIEEVKNKYSIDTNYVLTVGRLEPRKNVVGLLHAFHALKTRHALPQKLVIAGMKDFKYQEIFDTVENLQMADEVIFTGRIAQKDLPGLYNGADVFVYPSFAEGFGIPPLEAMSCGTPVVCSNTSSLPEVVGRAAVTIDPHDIEGLSNALYEVLTNDDLKLRLRQKGLQRAKKFSWHRSAEIALKCYEQVGSRK
ncbi:MAG: glycosyltransferase family 1 protein [Candidatus Electrothrix sp. MAN1_4]|nr:glycosyltransferase family 1 protein [Candidatus Electrothrix sp. MAN1_4]